MSVCDSSVTPMDDYLDFGDEMKVSQLPDSTKKRVCNWCGSTESWFRIRNDTVKTESWGSG